MLSRSRVSGILDMGRLSQAVSRPGIDPRTWVSLAIVNSVVVDPVEGVFCGITLMPSEIEETARLGAAYAGNGFGFYAPPRIDDEVMVCAPSGDPSQGLVITGRLWSPSDVPPAEASSHPQDVLLKVEEGQTLRMLVSGGGKVYLGGDTDTKAVAHVDSSVAASGAVLPVPSGLRGWMSQVTAAVNTLAPGSITVAPPTTIGSVSSGSSIVEVKP